VITPDLRPAPPLQYAPLSTFGLRFTGLLLAGIFLISIASAARERPDQPYALIFGTVWSPDDRPAHGVKVKIRRENESKFRWELYSDHNGEFAQRVPAGREDYVVAADLKGYKSPDGRPLRADEVKVHVENDERVDIGVHLK